jgi:hypothetical protein
VEGLSAQGMHRYPTIKMLDSEASSALGRQPLQCSSSEYVRVNPPAGMSCSQYLESFISLAGGYLTNPESTAACNFCRMSNTDQFLAFGFNMFYDHAWRDLGLMLAYAFFNVRGTLGNPPHLIQPLITWTGWTQLLRILHFPCQFQEYHPEGR